MAGVEPVRSLDDIVRLGAEVKAKGFQGLKTNIIRFDGAKPLHPRPRHRRRAGLSRAQHLEGGGRRRL